MTDPADFLSRWSRRKREAEKGEQNPQDRTDASAAEAADTGRADAQGEDETREDAGAGRAVPDEPAIDLSKLPSLESITAETDIRPFLARGVPSALRQAALRKMWVADPNIRDFMEVAENQWDFDAPGEILGFDLSPPTGDLKRMVADILGDKPRREPEAKDAVATEEAAGEPVVAALDGEDAASQQGATSDQGSMRQAIPVGQDNDDAASQNNIATQQEREVPSKRRSHGGALPS